MNSLDPRKVGESSVSPTLRRAPAALTSIPAELLREISSHLTSVWDRAALLLVCRRFVKLLGTAAWDETKNTWRRYEGDQCSGQVWEEAKRYAGSEEWRRTFVLGQDPAETQGATQWRQLTQFVRAQSLRVRALGLSPEEWGVMYDDEVARLDRANRISRICIKRRHFLERCCRESRTLGLYFSWSENRICSSRRDKLFAKAHLRSPWTNAHPWENGLDFRVVNSPDSTVHRCDACFRLGPTLDAGYLLQLWKPYGDDSPYALHVDQIQLAILRVRLGNEYGIPLQSLAYRGFFNVRDRIAGSYSTTCFSIDAKVLRADPERGIRHDELFLRIQDITQVPNDYHRSVRVPGGGGTDNCASCRVDRAASREMQRMAELWESAMRLGEERNIFGSRSAPGRYPQLPGPAPSYLNPELSFMMEALNAQRQLCAPCGTIYRSESYADGESNTYEVVTRWLNMGHGNPRHETWQRHFHDCHYCVALQTVSAARLEQFGAEDTERLFEGAVERDGPGRVGELDQAALTARNVGLFRAEMERRGLEMASAVAFNAWEHRCDEGSPMYPPVPEAENQERFSSR